MRLNQVGVDRLVGGLAIGVDLGMVTTAVCVITESDTHIVRLDRPRKSSPFVNLFMLRAVRTFLSEVLQNAADPVVVACERMAHMRGAQADPLVAWEWAVRETVLDISNNKHAGERILLLPTGGQLKLFVSGSGLTKKDEVGRWVVHHWPEAAIAFTDDGQRLLTQDEIEAYALARFALCRRDLELGNATRTDPANWTAYQVRTAGKDLWSQSKKGTLLTMRTNPSDCGKEHVYFQVRHRANYSRLSPDGKEK